MTTAICPICSDDMSEPNLANCNSCHRDFHLQMRMDVEGKDCGRVWLHEENMHLVFGCDSCIDSGNFGAPAQAG
ncbi:MAG TPA: hypothetical protein VH951_13155 [Dehalococcoidia bacterium]|jgi:hypothetical protein